jgi:hypothetical protein
MTQDQSLPYPPSVPTWQQPTPVVWGPPVSGPPIVDALPDRTAARMIVATVAAGVLAQLLFAFQLLGVNFPLWIAVVLAAAWQFRPRTSKFDRLDTWLPVSALIFAAFAVLREDGMLLAFDLLAACLLTLASAAAFGGHAITRGTWLRVVALGAKAIVVYFAGAVYLFPGIRPFAALFAERRAERWGPVMRGLLLALPLLLVFAALFAAADAVFASQLRNLVNLDWIGPEAAFRTLLAAVAGWLFAGTLVCARILHRPPASAPLAAPLRLGTIEAVTVLLLLDAMFAVFAALQTAYLFGGADTFAVSGMTYSDYARRGFFELIIAAFLAGAVIIILDRLVAEHRTTHRLAAATLAAMTGFVALSAFVRLGLYQGANGWTELRFYALAAIVFVGIGVLLTLASELANRARWLPQLLLGSGLLVAIVCNSVGPQAFVTEQNLQRAIDPSLVALSGKTGLNVEYLSRLGADSVPALISARDRLPADERGAVEDVLRAHAHELARHAGAGWQSWNLARQRALDALASAGY